MDRTKNETKKGTGNLSELRIEQVSGSMENAGESTYYIINKFTVIICIILTLGIHVEITSEDNSKKVSGPTSSTSSTGDIEEDDENLPTLSSEQLARRPSFK